MSSLVVSVLKCQCTLYICPYLSMVLSNTIQITKWCYQINLSMSYLTGLNKLSAYVSAQNTENYWLELISGLQELGNIQYKLVSGIKPCLLI